MANVHYLGQATTFFGRPDFLVLPLSSPLGQFQRHAHSGGARRRRIGQSERVIQLTHHQKAAIRTDMRTPEFQPRPTVELHPITPL